MIVVAIVAGPPLAAVLWIPAERWRLPTADQVRTGMERPHTVVAAVVGAAAVALWLLLVVAIARRAGRAICGTARRLHRAALPSPAQMTAGSMAGVAALAVPSIVVAHPDAAPASTPAGTDLGGADLGAEIVGSQHADVPAGIELPGGGWVPYRAAVAVAVLGGAVWLHRRQHYQPGPSRFGQHHRDGDLQPLPGTADAIIASIEDQPLLQATPGSALPALPAGRLRLHGPGATGAARGLLITALLDIALADSPQTAVVVRATDLSALLGRDIAGRLPAGLRIDDGTVSRSLLGSPGGDHDRQQPILVICQRAEASTLQPAGHSVDRITAVVVGDDDHDGPRWHVTAQGQITGDDVGGVRRLCLLEENAATDLLRLVQHHAAAITAPRSSDAARHDPVARRGQLQMLGGCQLHVDGIAVHVRRSAGLQILAYLAIHAAGATTTDLVRAVWPGLSPNTITKRLHTTLSDLRQQLQPTLDEPIIRQDERYRLNPDLIATDLEALNRAITAAATAVTSHQRHIAAYAIIDAYHGELAAGFCWPWLQPAREALRREVIDAYLHLAAAARPAEARDLLQAALAVDPHSEPLRQQAQRILTAIGDGSP